MTKGNFPQASALLSTLETQGNLDAIAPAYSGHGSNLRLASGLPVLFAGAEPMLPQAPGQVQLAAKRLIDIVLAAVALVALLPLLAAIALAIKATSPGPVLFRQVRAGQHGRPITIYKFRSLHAGMGDVTGIAQTAETDPRITPLGRMMRRANIDELPQLLNILKGDMSIVGPRPHPFGMLAGGMPYDELVPYYPLRQMARPGLSGWAQVNGYRGPTTDRRRARARIDHDLAYIQNFSLFLDFKIIALTLFRELRGGSGT